MSDYGGYYTQEKFWKKIGRESTKAGKDVIEKSLLLFYALQSEEITPLVKTLIIAALGYFVFPFDAIPDMIPLIGYSDDLGVLSSALVTISSFINNEITEKTKNEMEKHYFGEGK